MLCPTDAAALADCVSIAFCAAGTFVNGMLWILFSPVEKFAAEFYDGRSRCASRVVLIGRLLCRPSGWLLCVMCAVDKTAINMFSMTFMFLYPVGSLLASYTM